MTYNNFVILFFYLLFSFSTLNSVAQSGHPFITNYSPKEYKAETQNWAITQDNRGVIYVGNNTGVLEFDGVSWRLIPTSNHTTARALAKDPNGRIYVGAEADFG